MFNKKLHAFCSINLLGGSNFDFFNMLYQGSVKLVDDIFIQGGFFEL